MKSAAQLGRGHVNLNLLGPGIYLPVGPLELRTAVSTAAKAMNLKEHVLEELVSSVEVP